MLEIGSSLREARQHRGLDLAEAEEATLIRRRYLEALEQEQFELLPAGSYRRSFLREYADFLGLDGESFVGEYDLRLAAQPPEPPNAPRRPSISKVRLLGEVLLARTAAVAAAVVFAGVGLWQLGESGGPGAVKTTRPATPRQAQHPAATVQPSPRRLPLLPVPSLTLTA
jgi:cytoskeletal protein RodZ